MVASEAQAFCSHSRNPIQCMVDHQNGLVSDINPNIQKMRDLERLDQMRDEIVLNACAGAKAQSSACKSAKAELARVKAEYPFSANTSNSPSYISDELKYINKLELEAGQPVLIGGTYTK